MSRAGLIVAALVLLAPIPSHSGPAGRAVAVILDTSGSMDRSDPSRYTVQITKILSDLLASEDRLIAIGMPAIEPTCRFGPPPGFEIDRRPGENTEFKRHLDRAATNGTGTHFGASIRAAVKTLRQHRDRNRLLLILADSGGLGGCRDVLTRALLAAHGEGVMIAAVNLGTSSGAFDQNPAFDFTSPALNARELVTSVGEIYQRFLGVKSVQSGRVEHQRIDLEIAPLVRKAFLVVAADGHLGPLDGAPWNPGAKTVDASYRSGRTTGLDRVLRQYRIVELDMPEPGSWRFDLPDLEARAGWLLIQELVPVQIQLRNPGAVSAGGSVVLEATLHDDLGRRIEDLSALPGLQVEATIDGREITLVDDGTTGDRTAGDGVLSYEVKFEDAGDKKVAVRLQDDLRVETLSEIKVEVVPAAWQIEVQSPHRAAVGSPIELAAEVHPAGEAHRLPEVSRIDVTTPTGIVPLRDDGRDPDLQSGDHTFTADWDAPGKAEAVELTYTAVGGNPERRFAQTAATMKIVEAAWALKIRTPPAKEVGSEVLVSVQALPVGQRDLLVAIRRVEVLTGDTVLILRDDGAAADHSAGDGVFTATWTPRRTGHHQLDYRALGGHPERQLGQAQASVAVSGKIRLGQPKHVVLGTVASGDTASALLDLSDVEIRGEFELQLTTDLDLSRAVLELETDTGWRRLGEQPVTLLLSEDGARRWPLRLRVGGCPETGNRSRSYVVDLTARGPIGEPHAVRVPLSLRVEADPWLKCWWPFLVAVSGTGALGVLVHGYASSRRFPDRYGIRISPEKDVSEGFFQSIARHPASRRRFYRNSSVYVTNRGLSRKPEGAIARLEAVKGLRVRAKPVAGVPLWKLGLDGDWEQVPSEGTAARFGTVFRNDSGTLFFEPRTG